MSNIVIVIQYSYNIYEKIYILENLFFLLVIFYLANIDTTNRSHYNKERCISLRLCMCSRTCVHVCGRVKLSI